MCSLDLFCGRRPWGDDRSETGAVLRALEWELAGITHLEFRNTELMEMPSIAFFTIICPHGSYLSNNFFLI